MTDKSSALYFQPESIGSDDGASCGICWKFAPETKGCLEVDGIIAAKGVCGLYVHGLPMGDTLKVTLLKIGKSEAGYIDEGDTHCANCEYMLTPGIYKQSRCGEVEGLIEGRGCCNLHERS